MLDSYGDLGRDWSVCSPESCWNYWKSLILGFMNPCEIIVYQFTCCCCSIAKSCPILCDPVDCSTRDFPDPHCLLEFTQIHVHGVSYAVQPSNRLLSPSSSALNLSQHQSLFQWVGSSHQGAKARSSASASFHLVNIQGGFPLGLTGLISLQFTCGLI